MDDDCLVKFSKPSFQPSASLVLKFSYLGSAVLAAAVEIQPQKSVLCIVQPRHLSEICSVGLNWEKNPKHHLQADCLRGGCFSLGIFKIFPFFWVVPVIGLVN